MGAAIVVWHQTAAPLRCRGGRRICPEYTNTNFDFEWNTFRTFFKAWPSAGRTSSTEWSEQKGRTGATEADGCQRNTLPGWWYFCRSCNLSNSKSWSRYSFMSDSKPQEGVSDFQRMSLSVRHYNESLKPVEQWPSRRQRHYFIYLTQIMCQSSLVIADE